MNFLAHIILAEPTPESIIGNVLGDFVKGNIASLSDIYSPAILRGIRQHRAIDVFTDTHPTFAEARSLLHPSRRRFAGIVVDIYYDYLLGQRAPNSPESLRPLIEQSYQCLRAFPLSDHSPLATVLPRMERQDWIGSPLTLDGLQLTFQRVSDRSPRLASIANALDDFRSHSDDYQRLFNAFWPQLENYSSSWLAATVPD